MILLSFGTRPEYIKIKPLIDQLEGNIPFRILFTGQHADLISKIDTKAPVVKLKIEDGPNRLDSIVSSIVNPYRGYIFNGIDSVLVQGDTTSAFAIALAAFHRRIKVIHLEAGLRTYDKNQPYPEEFNRQAISRIADLHLCPTALTAANLVKEMTQGRIEIVGNTVLDNLRDVEPSYSGKVVVTMHRRENHWNMDLWFEAIDKIAKNNKDLEFIIPLHPNPNVQKHKHLLTNLKIVDPMGYNEFIDLLAKTKLVITDSGGLQEETSFLKKKCIVCREKTERLEGIGTFAHMCTTPKDLDRIFAEVSSDHIPEGVCPYGDGHSAKRILEILKDEL